MATAAKRKRSKEVKLTDLDDDLMQKWLSKMCIMEQTAVARVCDRIKDNVYKLTTTMYEHDLPYDFSIEVIPNLPKLKNIYFDPSLPVCYHDLDEEGDKNIRLFLESVAKQKPNIERLINLPSKYKCHLIEMVRKYHKNYDGTKFKSLFKEENHANLLISCPGIKLGHGSSFQNGNLENVDKRTREERLSDSNLVSFDMSSEFSCIRPLNELVTMAKNLTQLSMELMSWSGKLDYSHIFDCAAKLPLKIFSLATWPPVHDGVLADFDWIQQDFNSFKKFLELNSLVSVTLIFPQDKKTYLEILKCFLDCPRNNFRHFSSRSEANDFSVSNFTGRVEKPALSPSMVIGLGHENDTFPIAKFIQKFSPKYREFQFKDKETMVKMIRACTDLIKNQPKVHFVFYANQGLESTISFRPIQLEGEKISFSTQEYPYVPREDDQVSDVSYSDFDSDDSSDADVSDSDDE